MSISDPLNYLGSIGHHSEPSNQQYLDRAFYLPFLTARLVSVHITYYRRILLINKYIGTFQQITQWLDLNMKMLCHQIYRQFFHLKFLNHTYDFNHNVQNRPMIKLDMHQYLLVKSVHFKKPVTRSSFQKVLSYLLLYD